MYGVLKDYIAYIRRRIVGEPTVKPFANPFAEIPAKPLAMPPAKLLAARAHRFFTALY